MAQLRVMLVDYSEKEHPRNPRVELNIVNVDTGEEWLTETYKPDKATFSDNMLAYVNRQAETLRKVIDAQLEVVWVKGK